jgi:pimeloyl-ACP methyl ester carboxylesterase
MPMETAPPTTLDVAPQPAPARERPRRGREFLHWVAVTVVGLAVLVTGASLAYNLATDGRDQPATSLYSGPFVRVSGTLVAYRTWGSRGTPIVLLGGFAEPTWVWQSVAPALARNHRVVAIDLPPFGYTERVGDPSLATWTGIVEGVIQRLGLVRPVIVGHSLGAGVAASVALRDPSAVSRIVFLDGDGLGSAGGGRGLAGAVLVDPYFTTLYRLLTGSDTVVRAILERALGPHHPPITHAMLEGFERPFLVDGTAAQLKRLAGHGIIGVSLADLARVRVPATVVWGQYDDVDAVSAGRRSAAVLHAPFVLIPDAGHLSMIVRPAAVAAVIAKAAASPR